MTKTSTHQEFEVLDYQDLSTAEQNLILAAKEISKKAYAPYSNFQVGAAVLLEDGTVLKSSNQENVSFPAGVCAEHLVLSYAGANFPETAPNCLALVARKKEEEQWAFVSPCGICRQVINEVENRFNKPIKLLILRPDGRVYSIPGIAKLLPLKFDDLNSK
ncbi:cytidine deaminase [Algoriphagus kandeliae]|uniref:Cytidine deaminase n=1 Tax=Algoriphagus kandeliae TaxID=2562278 RepID=A0A4Y9QR73_9BACT|nr:cytidine deaminase [Algoriphagus kandeliae]TFV93503.1 cytidine deaminase [Algoriphagus kandeliae]